MNDRAVRTLEQLCIDVLSSHIAALSKINVGDVAELQIVKIFRHCLSNSTKMLQITPATIQTFESNNPHLDRAPFDFVWKHLYNKHLKWMNPSQTIHESTPSYRDLYFQIDSANRHKMAQAKAQSIVDVPLPPQPVILPPTSNNNNSSSNSNKNSSSNSSQQRKKTAPASERNARHLPGVTIHKPIKRAGPPAKATMLAAPPKNALYSKS
jgi:hypothetical protein